MNIIEMMKGRKLLLALDAMLDYQEPGANPGHEPRKGGGRGRWISRCDHLLGRLAMNSCENLKREWWCDVFLIMSEWERERESFYIFGVKTVNTMNVFLELNLRNIYIYIYMLEMWNPYLCSASPLYIYIYICLSSLNLECIWTKHMFWGL